MPRRRPSGPPGAPTGAQGETFGSAGRPAGHLFLRAVVKGGYVRAWRVDGEVLLCIMQYLFMSRSGGAFYSLFGALPSANPQPVSVDLEGNELLLPVAPIGAERVVKLTLAAMLAAGVSTDVFKSHSLHGAAASGAVLDGVDAELIRARGGWSLIKILQTHYARAYLGVECPHPPRKEWAGPQAA